MKLRAPPALHEAPDEAPDEALDKGLKTLANVAHEGREVVVRVEGVDELGERGEGRQPPHERVAWWPAG